MTAYKITLRGNSFNHKCDHAIVYKLVLSKEDNCKMRLWPSLYETVRPENPQKTLATLANPRSKPLKC